MKKLKWKRRSSTLQYINENRKAITFAKSNDSIAINEDTTAPLVLI